MGGKVNREVVGQATGEASAQEGVAAGSSAPLIPLKVGVIGCGVISGIYLQNAARFDRVEIVAVADLDASRAEDRAAEYGVSAQSVHELLADPEVDAVVNLTVPNAHARVSRAILEAGKHVYSEKPLATEREDGRALLELALERGLRIGCAPDTFLGGGLQTSRKLLDDGWIGRPVAATAFLMSSGVEAWHPEPDFFYKPGAGPLFDMAPYYLTTLVSFFGPVRTVTGSASISYPERRIPKGPRKGQTILVETPTHVTASLEFRSGVVATLITSFDIKGSGLPRIEVYGSRGTLSVPDPNGFGGPVRMRRSGADEWAEVPLSHGYVDNSRGLGLADLAHAVASGRRLRVDGETAYHVLDVMQSTLESAATGRRLELESSCDRPEPLPLGPGEGLLDD